MTDVVAAPYTITAVEDALNIQHDWQQSLINKHDKFFINHKKFGRSTTVSEVECHDGVIKETEGFTVEQSDNKKEVTFTHASGTKRTFIAPTKEFNGIHAGSIYSVDISPSGNLCVSSDTTGQLKVWETKDGRIRHTPDYHVMDIYRCRFFPTGKVFTSVGMDMKVRVYRTSDGSCRKAMTGHKGPINDLGLVREGDDILTASKDGTLKVYHVVRNVYVQEYKPNIGALLSLGVGAGDHHFIAVGGEDDTATIFDTCRGQTVVSCPVESSATAVCLHRDFKMYVGTAEGNIYAYSGCRDVPASVIKTQRGAVKKILPHPTLGVIAAFNDGTIATYKDLFSATYPTYEFTGADCDPIMDISFAGKNLVACGRDKTVRLYDISHLS